MDDSDNDYEHSSDFDQIEQGQEKKEHYSFLSSSDEEDNEEEEEEGLSNANIFELLKKIPPEMITDIRVNKEKLK